MEEIIVEHSPDRKKLEQMGVFSWPVWEKDASSFDWEYSDQETCLILEGKVRVEPKDGRNPADFGAGDLVVFPSGMECTWKIAQKVRKHYKFG